jgi:dTDP-4-amino-4,6-dideoxygalactose transaminase
MRAARDLAYFGGEPAFSEPLHLAQLNLPDWEKAERSFREIFQRRYFTNNGPMVRALDDAFAEHLGVGHAVCVTNGTIGLMILARALELRGEVIAPAFTFPATVQALNWAGLKPVLCDVSPHTHMISPSTVAALVSDRTVGIAGVHLWGRACDPEGLQEFADRRRLTLFFDACHTVGCTHQGRRFGGFGAGEVFSFHATKVLNAAEGGCVTTNDPRLADRLRTLRNFHASETFAPAATRINGKMSEAQAAMALLSLDDLPRNIAANRARFERYAAGLRGLPGVALMPYPEQEANNFQYVVVEIDKGSAGLSRDTLLALLKAENVICRRHFYPGVHRMAAYAGTDAMRAGGFPATDLLCGSLLQLPTGQPISHDDVDRVCALVADMLGRAEEITAHFETAA